MQLTITDAAKLYRKQRKTIYRHIDAGRLSCGVRGDGHRVLDLSELIRVYGEPPQAVPTNDTPMTRDTPQGDTLLTRAMLDELVAMRRELVALREEVAQLRALPSPDMMREQPEKPQEPRKADTDTDPEGRDFRSLVDALRRPELWSPTRSGPGLGVAGGWERSAYLPL